MLTLLDLFKWGNHIDPSVRDARGDISPIPDAFIIRALIICVSMGATHGIFWTQLLIITSLFLVDSAGVIWRYRHRNFLWKYSNYPILKRFFYN